MKFMLHIGELFTFLFEALNLTSTYTTDTIEVRLRD
mgnify:CR=1 FL=1